MLVHVRHSDATVKSVATDVDAKTRKQRFLQRCSLISPAHTRTNSLAPTGTRHAFLPGGHRTGAPGKHIIRGSGNYRLIDENVRIFIAPPIQVLDSTPVSIVADVDRGHLTNPPPQLKPYVATEAKFLKASEERAVWGKLPPGGITPEHFLKVARAAAASSSQP